jgi:hypothetical protein
MQMSWPEQSLRVLHGPLHEDRALASKGMFMMLKRKIEDRKIMFDMGAIVYSFLCSWSVTLVYYRIIAYPFIEFPK